MCSKRKTIKSKSDYTTLTMSSHAQKLIRNSLTVINMHHTFYKYSSVSNKNPYFGNKYNFIFGKHVTTKSSAIVKSVWIIIFSI